MKAKKRIFISRADLEECIDNYFTFIQGEFELEQIPSKTKGTTEMVEEKRWLRQEEPPTISGLAYYLGFESRQTFEHYELNGRHGAELKRARLRIEAAYEKKLHIQSSTGAIFALKALGWNDKDSTAMPVISGTITIEIIDTGAQPAASEKEVEL